MWCSDCNTDFEDAPNSVIQVCPHCVRYAGKLRRVPKLHPMSRAIENRAVPGVEGGKLKHHQHHVRKERQAAAVMQVPGDLNWIRQRTVHWVIFGLFVFLVGQGLQIWAFLHEHIFVWGLANLVSILGISVAFGGAFASLQRFDSRLRELARLVARSESTTAPNPRILRERSAANR